MPYYVQIHGKQEGPYEIESIRQKLASGEIHSSTLAWSEGNSEWKPLSAFLDAPPLPVVNIPPLSAPETPLTGMLSFALGIICAMAWFVLILFAGIASARGAGSKSPVMMTLGILMFAGLGVNLGGIILGIVALFGQNIRKTLSIVGIALNFLEIFGFLLLAIIGIAMKHSS